MDPSQPFSGHQQPHFQSSSLFQKVLGIYSTKREFLDAGDRFGINMLVQNKNLLNQITGEMTNLVDGVVLEHDGDTFLKQILHTYDNN
jgi:hypothetical protein